MKRLIEIKKGNYLNFKYFIFYVFNLQIKFKKNCPLSLNIYPTDKFSIVLSRSSLQEVFYKKVFLKTSKGHRKTPVLEFCFNKIAHLRPATLPKKRLQHRCFVWILRTFLEHPYYRAVLAAASISLLQYLGENMEVKGTSNF